MVSVCMITYNHELYIKQAIEGFLMQKCNFPIELVIGEDCSTDNTRQICENYAAKYSQINLLSNKSNLGVMPNFVRTLQACTGRYIALCEGDDYWTDPLKLQKQVDFLEANEDYGLVHTNHDILEQSSGKVKYKIKNTKEHHNGNIFNDLIIRNEISTLTAVARKNLIVNAYQKYQDQWDSWLMGDYPLWLEISKSHKIKYMDQSTSVYRVTSNSVSNSSTIAGRIKFIESTCKIKHEFCKIYDIKDPYILKEIELERLKDRFFLAFFRNQNEIKKYYLLMQNCTSILNLPIKIHLMYLLYILRLRKVAISVNLSF